MKEVLLGIALIITLIFTFKMLQSAKHGDSHLCDRNCAECPFETKCVYSTVRR